MGELSEREFDRIERFILGELSDSEANDFRTEMEANPELKKAVQEHREIVEAVEVEGLHQELDTIHGEMYGESSENEGGSNILIWSLAASFAIILGFAFWYFGQSDPADRLYAEYAYSDPGLPVPMSAGDTYDFYDAMVDYKTEDYRSAIAKWEKLLEQEPENDTLRYYIGASYFNLESFMDSEKYLREIARTGSAFRYRAQFMMILTDLKTGNASAVLETEALEGSPFREKIMAIKSELK
jgi:tetratricopeptide (TPR) repeat protein